ncbi:MAG: NAD-dependent succinate-semialdehyde dehydrogenase [Pseudomonadota bacterium]
MAIGIELADSSLLKTDAFISGRWIAANSGETFAVTNPADNTTVANVARCGQIETARAISAAHQALTAWRETPAKQRAERLLAWHRLMADATDDLAKLLTAEQGKPLAEAIGEIAYGNNYVQWFAEEAKRIYGDTIAPPSPDKRLIVIKQPVGVVACITPWNFPNAMLARKIAPALAAGCTVVCKPANETPLSALAMAELAHRAGIPDGVINVLCGDTPAIGAELTGNPTVRKLTFTGSTAVGKLLMQQCAGTVKRTSMELGGNAPFIVFDDADIDSAVHGAMLSKFRNAGQTCVCANRLLIHDRVYDEFAAKLSKAAAQQTLGNGADAGVSMGPLIHEKAAANVYAIIDDAVASGAKAVLGGTRSELGPCFVEPTVLTGVTDRMRVFQDEIFGPVAPLIRFHSEAEAVALANDTPYGLASYFYSRDIGRVWRVGEALEYGMVGINEGILSNETAPFGGVKESGQGREGSRYGLDDYLEIKYLCMGGVDQ